MKNKIRQHIKRVINLGRIFYVSICNLFSKQHHCFLKITGFVCCFCEKVMGTRSLNQFDPNLLDTKSSFGYDSMLTYGNKGDILEGLGHASRFKSKSRARHVGTPHD